MEWVEIIIIIAVIAVLCWAMSGEDEPEKPSEFHNKHIR